jgi:hypothetical protein
MALTREDLANIAELLTPLKAEISGVRTELKADFSSIKTELSEFRSETLSNFDALFLRDEKRETENLLRDEQVGRIEGRVDALEKKVA